MMQNILIGAIIVVCAFFIGRRFYNSIRRSGAGCGCGSGCSGCGPAEASTCNGSRAKSDSE